MAKLTSSNDIYSLTLGEMKDIIADHLKVPAEAVYVSYKITDIVSEYGHYPEYEVSSISVTVDKTKL